MEPCKLHSFVYDCAQIVSYRIVEREREKDVTETDVYTYPTLVHLGNGRGRGHDDGGRHTQLLSMIGQGLGMIAGTGGNDALDFLVVGLLEQLQNGIAGAAFLEGSGKLSKFMLQIYVGPDHFAQKGRIIARGTFHSASNRHFGPGNVSKGNGQCRGIVGIVVGIGGNSVLWWGLLFGGFLFAAC